MIKMIAVTVGTAVAFFSYGCGTTLLWVAGSPAGADDKCVNCLEKISLQDASSSHCLMLS